MEKFEDLDRLLQSAQNNNEEAERKFFLFLFARIADLVKYKVKRRSKHPVDFQADLDDLISETIDTVRSKYKSKQFSNGFIGFAAWLNQIVYYKVGNYFRASQNRAGAEIDLDTISDDPMKSPDTNLEAKEAEEIIFNSLNKLKPLCKEIISALIYSTIGIYVAQRKQEDPEGTIYNQIFRCRERFAALLRIQGLEI